MLVCLPPSRSAKNLKNIGSVSIQRANARVDMEGLHSQPPAPSVPHKENLSEIPLHLWPIQLTTGNASPPPTPLCPPENPRLPPRISKKLTPKCPPYRRLSPCGGALPLSRPPAPNVCTTFSSASPAVLCYDSCSITICPPCVCCKVRILRLASTPTRPLIDPVALLSLHTPPYSFMPHIPRKFVCISIFMPPVHISSSVFPACISIPISARPMLPLWMAVFLQSHHTLAPLCHLRPASVCRLSHLCAIPNTLPSPPLPPLVSVFVVGMLLLCPFLSVSVVGRHRHHRPPYHPAHTPTPPHADQTSPTAGRPHNHPTPPNSTHHTQGGERYMSTGRGRWCSAGAKRAFHFRATLWHHAEF